MRGEINREWDIVADMLSREVLIELKKGGVADFGCPTW